MKQPKKPKGRSKLLYIDEDRGRFEARLGDNARTREPRVPAMRAGKGKRNKFTGLSIQATVAAVKAAPAKKTRKRR